MLSLNLATQYRLKNIAETQDRLLVSSVRLKTERQIASHASLCKGLDMAWERVVGQMLRLPPEARPRA